MFKRVGEMLAKLSPGTRKAPSQPEPDPLSEKMRSLKWAPTEDDRSAEKYLHPGDSGAPLAEIMASSYLGRSGEPIER